MTQQALAPFTAPQLIRVKLIDDVALPDLSLSLALWTLYVPATAACFAFRHMPSDKNRDFFHRTHRNPIDV